MLNSDYYDGEISEESFEEALSLYEDYMKKNNLECEFTSKDLENFGFDAVSEEVLSHVLYHAEMNGFSIEEHLIL